MRILITGANGLIGKKVAKLLVASGKHEVYATSHKRLQIEGATTFTSDLLNADINSIIEKINAQTVIHCAALSNPDACEVDRFQCINMNIKMVQRFAAACRDYNVHFVLLSTSSVFDGTKGNYSEDDPANPISFFGESKMEAEKILQSIDLQYAIIRTTQAFGYEPKLSRQNFLLNVVKKLSAGKELNVPVDRICSFCLAEDLAVGIEAVATRQLTGLYHIAGDQPITYGDFALLVAKAFNLDTSLLKMIPVNQLIEAAPRPFNSSLNISKVQRELGFTVRPIPEAIEFVKAQMLL